MFPFIIYLCPKIFIANVKRLYNYLYMQQFVFYLYKLFTVFFYIIVIFFMMLLGRYCKTKVQSILYCTVISNKYRNTRFVMIFKLNYHIIIVRSMYLCKDKLSKIIIDELDYLFSYTLKIKYHL